MVGIGDPAALWRLSACIRLQSACTPPGPKKHQKGTQKGSPPVSACTPPALRLVIFQVRPHAAGGGHFYSKFINICIEYHKNNKKTYNIIQTYTKNIKKY